MVIPARKVQPGILPALFRWVPVCSNVGDSCWASIRIKTQGCGAGDSLSSLGAQLTGVVDLSEVVIAVFRTMILERVVV